MKKITILFATCLIITEMLLASPKYRNAPYASVDTVECVTISSTTWTLNPTSQYSGRDGVLVSYNANELTTNASILLTNSSTTPTISTMTVSYILDTSTYGGAPFTIPAGADVYIWMTIDSGAASDICTTAFKNE